MFTVNLGEKSYKVDYVRAIVLREIDKPIQIIKKMEEEKETVLSAEEMDKLVKWFALFLGAEATEEEIYTLYPADRLLYDIHVAIYACQARVTEALKVFPTQAAKGPQMEEKERG